MTQSSIVSSSIELPEDFVVGKRGQKVKVTFAIGVSLPKQFRIHLSLSTTQQTALSFLVNEKETCRLFRSVTEITLNSCY
jgi:hypothetical protein